MWIEGGVNIWANDAIYFKKQTLSLDYEESHLFPMGMIMHHPDFLDFELDGITECDSELTSLKR